MSVRPHVHTAACAAGCTRRVDDAPDPMTTTGAFRVVAGVRYGERAEDKYPRWWPFALRAWDAAWKVATVLGIAWASKRLGLTS